MDYLKKFWNWLLNRTTVDEKIAKRVTDVKKELVDVKKAANVVVEEAKDVIEAAKGKKPKRKPRRSGASSQTVSKSGASSQSFKK